MCSFRMGDCQLHWLKIIFDNWVSNILILFFLLNSWPLTKFSLHANVKLTQAHYCRCEKVSTMRLLVVFLSFIISVHGECPHQDFVQKHVCDTCRGWKEVCIFDLFRWHKNYMFSHHILLKLVNWVFQIMKTNLCHSKWNWSIHHSGWCTFPLWYKKYSVTNL